MWCRTILTAVAISYIICMLLLSGLQKEDLDANTLEKLSRHNVNIDDMNNESRRQECLLNSYLTSGNNTEKIVPTEDHNEVSTVSTTNKSIVNNANVQEYPKLETQVPVIIEDKNVQNETYENVTGLIKPQDTLNLTVDIDVKTNIEIDTSHNLENETGVTEYNDLQTEYIQTEPDLQSVMNFWTKLTQYTEKVVIKAPTTSVSPYISEEKNITTVEVESTLNNGYVHSREMEYISRVLAEYLANQATTATTEKDIKIKAHKNLISRKTENSVKDLPMNEELYPTFPRKNFEQPLNYNDVKNFTQINMQPQEVYNTTDATKNTKDNVSYDDRQPDRKSSFETMHVEVNPLLKYNPIRFLDNLLHVKNVFNFNDEPIAYTDSTSTKSIKWLINKDDDRKEKSETFERYNFLQFMKDVNNNDSKQLNKDENLKNNNKLKIPPIHLKQWEPIRNHRVINRQFKVIPIDKNERGPSQDFEINNEKIWKISEHPQIFSTYDQINTAPILNNTKQTSKITINIFDDTPTRRNESEEIQNISMNAADMKIMNQNLIEKLQQHHNSKSINNSLKVRRIDLNKLKNISAYGDFYKAWLGVKNRSDRNQSNIDTDLIKTEPFQINQQPAYERNQMSNIDGDQFKVEPEAIRNNQLNLKGFNEIHFNAIPVASKKSERNHESHQNQMIKINSEQFNDATATNNYFYNMPAARKKLKRKHESYLNQMSKMDSDQFDNKTAPIRNFEPIQKASNFIDLYDMPALRKKSERKQRNQMPIKEPPAKKKLEQTSKVSNHVNAMPAVRKKMERLHESYRNQVSKIDSDQFDDETATIRNFEQIEKSSNVNYLNALPAMRKNMERKQESERKQTSKMYNNQFNVETATIRNIKNTSMESNDKRLNAVPELTETNGKQDSSHEFGTQNQSLQINHDKLLVAPVSIQQSKPNQTYDMNFNEQPGIPVNVINDIAEKVKQIVLRDIEKELTTTTVKNPSSTTIPVISPTTTVKATSSTTTVEPSLSTTTVQASTTTTIVPPIITTTSIKMEATTTVKLSTLQKEITEANYVIQKLMEIFDEFKAMKDAKKSTANVPQNTTTLNYVLNSPNPTQLPKQIYNPPMGASFNPYIIETPTDNLKSIELSPYGPSMVPMLLSSGVNLLHQQQQAAQYVPQLNFQPRKEQYSSAITIQTNSNEVAPLAIQISNPVKVINKNYLVTTKRPTDKLKEQNRQNKIRLDEKFSGLIEHENQKEKLHLQDNTKKVRFSDIVKRYQEYGDGNSYRNRINNNREEPLYRPDYSGNFHHTENYNHPPSHPQQRGTQDRISRQDKIRHHMPPLSYIRQHPRYDATKFHEKLERIENWPRNTWREFNMNCCDEIPARQQMSLSRVKQRTRYDDTHFTNFLKSQQKVTDMLEKILANKMKPSGHSVETT